jgi:hypothetical protein
MDVAWKLIEDFRADWCVDPCYQRAGCGCADMIQDAIDAAVAAEREACAKLAEGEINGDFRSWPHQPGDYDNVCMQSKLADAIAASIRNR